MSIIPCQVPAFAVRPVPIGYLPTRYAAILTFQRRREEASGIFRKSSTDHRRQARLSIGPNNIKARQAHQMKRDAVLNGGFTDGIIRTSRQQTQPIKPTAGSSPIPKENNKP